MSTVNISYPRRPAVNKEERRPAVNKIIRRKDHGGGSFTSAGDDDTIEISN